VQAPEDLESRVREALERRRVRRPLFLRLQPVLALLVLGVSAGILLDKMKREELLELEKERFLPAPTALPTQEEPPPTPAAKKRASVLRLKAVKKATPVPAPRKAEPEPEPARADSKAPVLAEVESAPPSPPRGRAAFDSQGAEAPEIRAASAPESTERAASVRRPAEAPDYAELMDSAGRHLARGNQDHALAYWNAALNRMRFETRSLPDPGDLSLCAAWLELGRKDPVSGFLRALSSRERLTVPRDQFEAWKSLLDKDDFNALIGIWKEPSLEPEKERR
jgi:hypothetical protein